MSSYVPPSPKRFDVFISFRGEDTRTNFTSHLHTALCDKNIATYIDYNLGKGDDIWTTLSGAIQDSHISLVVFSRDYALSKWCLEELVKIMECRKDSGQVVIPVFYKIDPSQVRKQTGSYGEAFAQHEQDVGDNESNQCRVHRWRAALTEAANISGWDSRIHRDDSQVIQNIVNDVLQKLYLRYPNELKGIVGIDEVCRHLELLLKNVRVIGIWGMGGIGKTTITRVLFAKLFPQYDSVCFLANVRAESKRIGLTSLRDKLLYELLKEESPISNDVGSTFIMRRLTSKKVLVVLDDVDSYGQLEYLCGERGDLGEDITLIVTTRDRHLLCGRVDEIYEVKEWKYEESKELFCLNAFKRSHPQEGYEYLLHKTVHYAQGVPLALKVLGSHLYSRSHEFWESTLSKLEKYPNEKILNVLKVSYDGLDSLEKNIFLDIAFFFKGEDKDRVARILDACGFYAASGIDILVDKALITISYGYSIQMHDLLQQMGLEIVRQECSKNPGSRSRLRGNEAYDVLLNNKGTDAVEGIILDLSQIVDLRLSADTFDKMPNLRFLQLYLPSCERSSTVYHPTVLNALSNELRCLEWNGYPFKSLPPTFCAKFLVEIHMPYSPVEDLWQGMQDLSKLMGIDLRGCKQLTKLPDLSRASKLKWVDLSGCESLRDLHPSIVSLDTLVSLNLNCCIKLKCLKSEKHLRSLEEISVNGCSSLKEFSLSSDLIKRLDFANTGIKILHSSISRLSNLRELNLDGSRVDRLPGSIKHLQKLQKLSLKNCTKLRCLPELPPSIEQLYVHNCKLLVTVSSLKGFAAQMKGKDQHFSFNNCMKLDRHSLNCIMKGTQLTMMSAVFHNVLVRRYHSYRYNSGSVCLPGSSVPKQFTHRTTKSSINIELPSRPNLLGFFLSVVLFSPSPTMKKERGEIFCIWYLPDGTYRRTTYEFTADLNSDHVFVWYDPFHCDNILRDDGPVSFKFGVTFESCKHDGLIVMKECGVRLICVSEIQNFLGELELELDKKKELEVMLGLALEMEQLDWKWYLNRRCLRVLQYGLELEESEFESVRRAVLTAIEETQKSNGFVSNSQSVSGEMDKKVELGLTFDMKQLALDIKQLAVQTNWALVNGSVLEASWESKRRAILTAILKEAQKSNEFVAESLSFLGELELEFDKKVELGVILRLELDMEQNQLKKEMHNKSLDLLVNASGLEASLKLGFESRHRAILAAINEETQESKEFVFPTLPTRICKNTTQGLKYIVSLLP